MNAIFLSLAMAVASAVPQHGFAIVSYRIVAPPNSVVEYAGQEYRLGPSGTIELIADPQATTVSAAGSVFNLPMTGPTDDFGSVTVSLLPQTEGYKSGLQPRGAKTRAAR